MDNSFSIHKTKLSWRKMKRFSATHRVKRFECINLNWVGTVAPPTVDSVLNRYNVHVYNENTLSMTSNWAYCGIYALNIAA